MGWRTLGGGATPEHRRYGVCPLDDNGTLSPRGATTETAENHWFRGKRMSHDASVTLKQGNLSGAQGCWFGAVLGSQSWIWPRHKPLCGAGRKGRRHPQEGACIELGSPRKAPSDPNNHGESGILTSPLRGSPPPPATHMPERRNATLNHTLGKDACHTALPVLGTGKHVADCQLSTGLKKKKITDIQ